jgi:hypothetical protein
MSTGVDGLDGGVVVLVLSCIASSSGAPFDVPQRPSRGVARAIRKLPRGVKNGLETLASGSSGRSDVV